MTLLLRRKPRLRWRLPNPPPFDPGRELELERLAVLIERGPVVVVTGLHATGKTNAVLHVLHRRFAPQVERLIFARVSPPQPLVQLLLDVAAALSDGLESAPPLADAPSLDDVLEVLVDRLEDCGAWLVLDDLHEACPVAADHCLDTLSRYTRASRVIATSRVPPRAGLNAQLLHLGPVSDHALAVLGPLDAPSTALLCTLAASRSAVPRAVLERALGPIAPALMAELERRALVQRTEHGLALDDVTRALVIASAQQSPELAVALARALATSPRPADVLEALRLTFEHAPCDAPPLLERRGDELLGASHAAELWALIDERHDERLAYWRLRCALELGSVDLRELAEPPPDALAARLVWAKLLIAEARFAESAAICVAIGARATAADDALVFEAVLTRAEALGYAGRCAEAVSALEGADTTDASEAAVRDARAARWLVHTGAFDAAKRLARAAHALLATVAERQRCAVTADLAFVFSYLSPQAAAGLPLGQQAGALVTSPRRLGVARCLTALAAGRVGAVMEQSRALAAVHPARPLDRLYLDLCDVTAALAHGDLADLGARCDQLMANAEALNNAEVYYSTAVVRERLATMLAVEIADVASPRLPSSSALIDDLLRAARWQRALRSGRARAARAPDGWRAAAVPSVQIWRAELSAEEALLAGALDDARRGAAQARDLARADRRALQEADATELLTIVEVVAGDDLRLREAVAGLARIADAFPSRRYAAHVRFFEAALAAPFPQPDALEVLAADAWTSPRVCRWARALLGVAPALDAVDRLVVDAVRRRAGTQRVEVLMASGQWRPGWGIDEVRQRVWLPTAQGPARMVDLTRSPLLLRCLTTLADEGGRVSKETLFLRAWGENGYHRLRHDKRIHVAVRELRERLEDLPSSPTRVVTIHDGYAFGAHEQVRRLRAS